MHEAASARSIVAAACRVAAERDAGIRALTLEVDAESADPVAVELHTRAAAVGTVAEDAAVLVEPRAGAGHHSIRLVSVTLCDA